MARRKVVECLDTADVCRIVGVNKSTLDYWVRTDLVTPSLRTAPGHRRTRLWTPQDVTVVRLVHELRQAGCPLQRVRLAQRRLTRAWRKIDSSTVLYWTGRDVLRVGPWGEVESLLKHPGQQVLQLVVLPVGKWASEIGSQVSYINCANLLTGTPRSTPEAAEAMG